MEESNQMKKVVGSLIIAAIITLIIMVAFVESDGKSTQSIEYVTAITEVNNILNKSYQAYERVDDDLYKEKFYLDFEDDELIFEKKSVLLCQQDSAVQINYQYQDNIISLLRVCVEKYSNYDYYFFDECNVLVYTIYFNDSKATICNNLSKNISRNFYYYDVIDNRIIVRCTRANEIFFYYNKYLYYIGLDLKLDKIQIEKFINEVLNVMKSL